VLSGIFIHTGNGFKDLGIDSRDAGWEEELSDALEEIRALAGDYRKAGIPAAKALADRLEQAAGE
jgi:hypothetical protein